MLPKDREALFKLARRKGFTFEHLSSGHTKITNPETREFVFVGGTPGDWRADLNNRSRLKRLGLTDTEVKEAAGELPEPKLVMDRSKPPGPEGRDFLVAPKKKMRERGSVKNALLESMRRVGDRPQGLSSKDIYARMQSLIPGIDEKHVGAAMAKFLVRVGPGKYRLPTEQDVPVRKEKAESPPARTEPSLPYIVPVPQVDLRMDDDYQVLERALDALAAVEQVIRKHQDIVRLFAGFKNMMAIAGGPSGGSERNANDTGGSSRPAGGPPEETSG